MVLSHPSTRRFCRCFGFNLCCSRSFHRISPPILNAILAATQRLDLSLDPHITLDKLRSHRWHWKNDAQYALMISIAGLSLYLCALPWFLKIFILIAYTTALLVPLTSQFFLPASPIFTWVIMFFSNRYIPFSFRSKIHIWVSILPTLESVLYGANISDILTRYTNPFLDVVAWLPYGVLHFVLPFVTAIFLFVFGGPGAVKFFGKAFGYMNIAGVAVQILFPCAPPWYELSHGITPANYNILGEAGGLARIDHIFHSKGYTTTFRNSPIVFGAFPSLHAGCATLEALFLSHYFPRWRVLYWTYAFILYWSTMYLTHHYLVDLVAGGSFAIAAFYLFLTEDQRHLPMLNASNAGEEESIAKGYHTGIRGMLGHKGANGSWTTTPGQAGEPTSSTTYHLDQEDVDKMESGSLYLNSDVDLGIPMVTTYRSPSKTSLTMVHSRAPSPVPGSHLGRSGPSGEADVSFESVGFGSVNGPGSMVEPTLARARTTRLDS